MRFINSLGHAFVFQNKPDTDPEDQPHPICFLKFHYYPGRFDRILDLNLLEPAMYMELIQERCKIEYLIQLFAESILKELKDKNVSGVFVLNLISKTCIKVFIMCQNKLIKI